MVSQWITDLSALVFLGILAGAGGMLIYCLYRWINEANIS